MTRGGWGVVAALAWLGATGAAAQTSREPVLKQVAAPHSYYWRELYLPQLTMGPSGVSFMPTGDELVYSMAGSLWRQRIDSPAATELTHAPGAYDYQPDVAQRRATRGVHALRRQVDGTVGARPLHRSRARAHEEWRGQRRAAHLARWTTARVGLDAARGALRRPRRRSRCGRAHERGAAAAAAPQHDRSLLLLGDRSLDEPGLVAGRPVALLRRQSGGRLGYGRHLDGRARESADAAQGAERGNDLERASGTVAGRAARSCIRAITAGNGTSSGSRHRRAPLRCRSRSASSTAAMRAGRPTASRSRTSATSTAAPSSSCSASSAAHTTVVRPTERLYRTQRGLLEIDARDAQGRALPVRISVVASDQRAYAPDDGWMHADDGFDRELQRTETHYFHCTTTCSVSVPAGAAQVDRAARISLYAAAAVRTCRRGTDREAGSSAAPQRAAARVRQVAQRRSARAHELWRPLPQHAAASGGAGARRGSRRRPEPDRQQGRARARHRVLPHGSRSRGRQRRRCCCTRRNITRASGATWRCCTSASTTCCRTSRATDTRRSRARTRTTACSPTSHTSRAA